MCVGDGGRGGGGGVGGGGGAGGGGGEWGVTQPPSDQLVTSAHRRHNTYSSTDMDLIC